MKSVTPVLFAVLLPVLAAAADTVPYTVRPGDTLFAIAVRNGTTVKDLLRENGLADPNRIRAGQTIRLPAPPAVQQTVPRPAPAPAAWQPVSVPEPAPPPAQDAAVPALREESFYDVWIRDRLALGVSFSWRRLTDGDRPRDLTCRRTFLGYINKLDEENELDWEPVLTWLAGDFVRVGLTWDEVEARTMNCNVNAETGRSLSDGVVSSAGPVLLLEGAYPLEGGVWRPHAGIGLGWYRGDFDEDAWWALGYPGPKSWKAAGKARSKAYNDRRRYIDVDDATGVSLAVGVAWRPIQELELDLSLRRTWLEPDCEFGYADAKTGRRERQSAGEFTLDNLAVSLAVSYVF